jgi:hypothetical protein
MSSHEGSERLLRRWLKITTSYHTLVCIHDSLLHWSTCTIRRHWQRGIEWHTLRVYDLIIFLSHKIIINTRAGYRKLFLIPICIALFPIQYPGFPVWYLLACTGRIIGELRPNCRSPDTISTLALWNVSVLLWNCPPIKLPNADSGSSQALYIASKSVQVLYGYNIHWCLKSFCQSASSSTECIDKELSFIFIIIAA